MRSELDTLTALTWCKEHPLVFGWLGGSIILSIGVGILAVSAGGAVLCLGICCLVGIAALAAYHL